MFRLLLTAVALVGVAAQAEAYPFMPNYGMLEILGVRFVETGTNAVCLQCDDLDPYNDFKAVINFGDTAELAPAIWSPWGGGVDFTGTTTNDYSNVNLHVEVDMKWSMWMDHAAESEWEKQYPHKSISYGEMTGTIFGWDSEFLIEECCDGSVGALWLWDASYQSGPFRLPPWIANEDDEYSSWGRQLTMETIAYGYGDDGKFFDYTPVVSTPEPASLLLLGGGLVAGWTRRRVKKRD